jgi:hypothetical protein
MPGRRMPAIFAVAREAAAAATAGPPGAGWLWHGGASAAAAAWLEMTRPAGERVLGESPQLARAEAAAAAALCIAAAAAWCNQAREECGGGGDGVTAAARVRMYDGGSDGSSSSDRAGSGSGPVQYGGPASGPTADGAGRRRRTGVGWIAAAAGLVCHVGAGVGAVWWGQTDLYALLWAASLSAVGLSLRVAP